jgi:hypothetical protein
MIDALIKRVSVTYACYEMYAHRGKKVQLLVFWDHQEMAPQNITNVIIIKTKVILPDGHSRNTSFY